MKKLFILIIFFILINCSENNKYICKVTHITGNAYEVDEKGNITKPLKENTLLKTSISIKTDKNSYVDVEFTDKSKMRIQEDSIIKIENFAQGFTSEKTKIYLKLGESFAKLDRALSGKNIEFETDTMIFKQDNAEFVVSVTNDKVTKVAVLNGKLNYSTKLNSIELNAIKNINPKIAAKIEDLISKDKTLNANEKIEISNKDYIDYNSNISKVIAVINNELEKTKNNSKESEDILKKYALELDNISVKFTKENKHNITQDEWKEILSLIEQGKTSMGNKSIDENIESEYKWFIKKLPESPGIILTEKNTSLTADTNNLYISSNSNNALYCINPIKGVINWTFTDNELNNIFSPVVTFKNMVVLTTPDKFFALNKEGQKISANNISGGITYWASPVKTKTRLFIPTTSGIYELNNGKIDLIKNIPVTTGQIYMTEDSNILYYIDINELKINAYNLADEKINKTSEKLANPVFMPPVIYKGYIYIADNRENIYRFDNKTENYKPEILKVETGVIVNFIFKDDFLYFLGNNGYFYKINLKSFNDKKAITKIEFNPDINKYLTKKLMLFGDEILYCSDTGKLFIYDTKNNEGVLQDIPENQLKLPLISSPVMIGNVIFFIDQKSNIYKRYKDVQ